MRVTIVAVNCPHCNTRQKVHMIGRTSASQIAQYVKCLNCQQPFEVMLPNKIVAGPFPGKKKCGTTGGGSQFTVTVLAGSSQCRFHSALASCS